MLVDRDILGAMQDGLIIIEPFVEENLGTNSYDVTLSPHLRVYDRKKLTNSGLPYLDTRTKNETAEFEIQDEGFILVPGTLYLASTNEYTETRGHVPVLNGKSSLGRLGLSIHVTAGFGDVGFCGHWTMELFVIQPLRIYPNMKIAQLCYHKASSVPLISYDQKKDAKYNNKDWKPQASLNHQNFRTEE